MLLIDCTPLTLSQNVIRSANYGSSPECPEVLIQNKFVQSLKDPESARYRMSAPFKAYASGGISGWEANIFGWAIDVE
jgi:hypothetical protein